MNNEKQPYLISWWVIITSAVIMLFIGWSFFIYHDSIKLAKHEKEYADALWMKQIKTLNRDLQSLNDSTALTTGYIIDLRRATQQLAIDQVHIIKHQESIVADLRQETNNYINKANGLMSIWVGILSFVGIVLPLIFQYKLSQENKNLDEKLTADIEREIKYLHKVQDKSELSNLTRTLEICNDYRMIPNYTDAVHTPVQNLFWQQSICIFKGILDESFEQVNGHSQLRADRRENLLQALIILFGVIRNYIIPPDSHRHSDFDYAITELRKEIYRLSNNDDLFSTEYHDKLSKFSDFLNKLFEN